MYIYIYTLYLYVYSYASTRIYFVCILYDLHMISHDMYRQVGLKPVCFPFCWTAHLSCRKWRSRHYEECKGSFHCSVWFVDATRSSKWYVPLAQIQGDNATSYSAGLGIQSSQLLVCHRHLPGKLALDAFEDWSGIQFYPEEDDRRICNENQFGKAGHITCSCILAEGASSQMAWHWRC